MTGREDEAEQVVVDVVRVRGLVQVGRRGLQVTADLRQLARVPLLAAHEVDRPVLGGGHEPRAGVVGDPLVRPLLQGGDERVLRQFLRYAHVPDDARDTGDDAGRLQTEDGLDGVGRFGSTFCCHGPPSDTRTHGAAKGLSGVAQPSAISRISEVTVQCSSWTFRNRLVHSRISARSLAWMIA